MMSLNLIALIKDSKWLKDNFDYDSTDRLKSLPFINYILEDKSIYTKASDLYNSNINRNHIDKDEDFLVGHSGGFLLNWNFVLVNTDEYCQAAINFAKHKVYTLYPKGSIEYKKFYAEEDYRRKHGYTRNCKLYLSDVYEYFNPKTSTKRKKELLHPLRITGDHYSYLNYGRIERTPNETERKELDRQGLFKTKTIEDFPRFSLFFKTATSFPLPPRPWLSQIGRAHV